MTQELKQQDLHLRRNIDTPKNLSSHKRQSWGRLCLETKHNHILRPGVVEGTGKGFPSTENEDGGFIFTFNNTQVDLPEPRTKEVP